MARGFGSTFGGGASDVIVTGLTTDPTQRSYFLWVYRNGDGGSNFGYMFDQGDAGDSIRNVLYNNTGTGQGPPNDTAYTFTVKWTGAYGFWNIQRPATGAWHAIGVSYDSGSTSNNAVFYLDNSKPSVFITGTPSGTYQSVSGNSLKIGNRPAGDLNWDGKLADFATWNVILTDNEFFSMAKGVRPYNIRPQNLVAYLPLDGLVSPEPDLSGLKNNGTLTGTAFQNDPPLTFFTPKFPSFPAAVSPSVLAMHQINAHFTRRITTVGY